MCATASPLTSITINDVADVVKHVLGESFVYNTSKTTAQTVLTHALRQDEEFSVLYTDVLWDEFIPDGKRTPNAKLSTLFNRNITYVPKHGLVTVRKKFLSILTAALFESEARHVRTKMIEYAAKARAFGNVFDDTKLAADENCRIDLIGARTAIRAQLASELYEAFVPAMAAEGSNYLGIYTAFVSAGYFADNTVVDGFLDRFISVLLLLALNLFPDDSKEYKCVTDRAEDYIARSKTLSRDQKREENNYEAISRTDAARLCLELAAEVNRRFDKGERVSRETLVNIIKTANIVKKYK